MTGFPKVEIAADIWCSVYRKKSQKNSYFGIPNFDIHGDIPGPFFVYIVQLSLTSLLSGYVARCHFPDFCRETFEIIIWISER